MLQWDKNERNIKDTENEWLPLKLLVLFLCWSTMTSNTLQTFITCNKEMNNLICQIEFGKQKDIY